MKWIREVVTYKDVEGTLLDFFEAVVREIRYYETEDMENVTFDLYGKDTQRLSRVMTIEVPAKLFDAGGQRPSVYYYNDVTLDMLVEMVVAGDITEDMIVSKQVPLQRR